MAKPITGLRRQIAKRGEASQRQRMELDTVLAAATDAMIIYDVSGTVVRANLAAIESFGFDPIGSDRAAIVERLKMRWPGGNPVPPDELPSGRAAHGEKIAGEKILFTSADGREFIVLVSSAPVAIDGNLAGVVAVWHDVTEREKLIERLAVSAIAAREAAEREQALREELEAQNDEIQSQQAELRALNEELESKVAARTAELRQANEALLTDIFERDEIEKALRESEERYRSLIEISPDAILVIDLEATVSLVNRHTLDLLGCGCGEDIVGRSALDFVAPEDHGKANESLKRILELGSARNVEYSLVKKDGGSLAAELSVSLITDAERKPYGFIVLVRDITERKRAEAALKEGLERLGRTLEGTIEAMSMAVEVRDPYTSGHQQRVAKLAFSIAGDMGLSEDALTSIRMSAAIHDVGKIYVPAEILSKPGRLNEMEFRMIMGHCQVAYDILSRVEFPWPIAQIVLQHHERMNGSGYPVGLSGEKILLEARILGVADVVEAMASHRPYRPALGIEAALEEVTRNKGILYDANVVDACVRLFEKGGFSFS